MSQAPELPSLPNDATQADKIAWLSQLLVHGQIAYSVPATVDPELEDLHQLLAVLLPERRIELDVSPFHPHQFDRDNRYFAEQWQRFAKVAGIEFDALEQHWNNFDQGLLEVSFRYQGQDLSYRYNLSNFDFEPDLHQFCDRFLDDRCYGCYSDEQQQVFVLLPEALIEELRAYRSPHWWRVR